MRTSFSLKGFDSAAGGTASPIVKGEPISLPIPTSRRSLSTYVGKTVSLQTLHLAGRSRPLTNLKREVFIVGLREKPALLPYRAVVVDESQDIGAEAYRLISAIAPTVADKHEQDSLFLVGDAHQRIYGRKAPMSKCGIDVRGRSRKLKVCYRTSDEIRRWAVAVLQGMAVDDLDDSSDDLKGYRSLFHGPAPEVHFEKTEKAEAAALVKWIEDCKGAQIEESDICVLARTNEVRNEIAAALKARDYATVVLQPRKADDRKKAGIRVATMHRAKGLEFTAVALVHVNEGLVPPKWVLDEAPDAAIRRSIVDGEKSLIHVSATRAKKRLFVGCAGQPSDLIRHLDSAGG